MYMAKHIENVFIEVKASLACDAISYNPVQSLWSNLKSLSASFNLLYRE